MSCVSGKQSRQVTFTCVGLFEAGYPISSISLLNQHEIL